MNHRIASIHIVMLTVAIVCNVASIAHAQNNGPHIIFKYPELMPTTSSVPTIQTTTSARFDMVFEPRQDAVDMYSLHVWARKGLFKKSLTDWLRPYIRGNRIVADEVKLPKGKFVLEIQIADRGGKQSSQQLHVVVQ